MNIDEIKELVELIQSSGIEEFEMEKAGVRLRIRNSQGQQASNPASNPPSSHSAAHTAYTEVARIQPPPEEEAEEELYVFRAPIVGTFYLTSKPDADPFVRPGDRVSKSQVVCIIEAMKIFNQIECDIDGEIVQILVENGQPVEYGEALFKIRQN